MKSSFVFAVIFFLTGAFAGKASGEGLNVLDVLPGMGEIKEEAQEPQDALQRPDTQKIMAELSQSLKLSSRQEERIGRVVDQKTKEFDKQMKEFDKNSEEQKKYAAKINENKEAMAQIGNGIPDLIRQQLDEEQRQIYEDILAAKNKPAPAPPAAAAPVIEPAVAKDPSVVQPRKKRRLVRRKKAAAKPVPVSLPAATPAPAPALAPDEEEGGVMVDKDPAASAQPRKKKRVQRKQAATSSPQVEAPAPEAGAATAAESAPEPSEDAGSYP